MKQSEIDWFRPLWRRVLVTAFCGIWTGWEWYHGEALWGTITAAAFAFCVYSFFITFPKDGGNAKP